MALFTTKDDINIIVPSCTQYLDIFAFHKGWALKKAYHDSNGSPTPGPGQNRFYGIPRTLFSLETVIYMGLELWAAHVVWDRWVAREVEVHPLDGCTDAFLHFILEQVIEFPSNRATATKEEWAESLSKCEHRLRGEVMDTVESSISKWDSDTETIWCTTLPDPTQRRVYVLMVLMKRRFQRLLQFRKSWLERESCQRLIRKHLEQQAAMGQAAMDQVAMDQVAMDQIADATVAFGDLDIGGD